MRFCNFVWCLLLGSLVPVASGITLRKFFDETQPRDEEDSNVIEPDQPLDICPLADGSEGPDGLNFGILESIITQLVIQEKPVFWKTANI